MEAPHSPRGVKRALALELWEGNNVKEMLSQAMPLRLVCGVQPSEETLATLTRRLHDKFARTVDEFASPPTGSHRKALLAMALHLDSGVNWDSGLTFSPRG